MNYDFDIMYQPFPSNRYCVTAKNGMVSTGNAIASQAGLEILKKGGNAVDAAIATAACLTVVEPSCNGIGSDAFAIVWMKDKMYGLNSSGRSPESISIEKVKAQGSEEKMPVYGWTPVTVPGAPKAWVELSKRFGKLSLKEALEPAIRYATEGFPLSPMIASGFEKATEKFKKAFGDKKEFSEWFRVFTKNGESYSFGDIVKLPDHARTLKLIAETEGKAFYEGEIAEAIDAQSKRDGGYITKEDLKKHEVIWSEPIGVEYKDGYKVWELPPNGQGIVALMALNMLRNFEFKEQGSAETLHKQFEAIKLAFADAKRYVTDPDEMELDFNRFLTPEYGKSRSEDIGERAAEPEFKEPPKSGTVYLCTADKDGNMVSFIQSNYMGFGSGIVVEGYGVALQNRGADFSLDPENVNCLKPAKRTYHTIIPGFLTRNGKAVGPFGVMGGYMQPQGHVQVAMNFIDFHLNPQMALDAPRWQWMKDKEFTMEKGFNGAVIEKLTRLGHEIKIPPESTGFGRGQMIVRLDNGVLVGGCESRTDSNIACW